MDRQFDRPIPEKIEQRLVELLKMKEFDMQEVNWCRSTYWARRSDWHAILVACHNTALARIAAKGAAAHATEGASMSKRPIRTLRWPESTRLNF